MNFCRTTRVTLSVPLFNLHHSLAASLALLVIAPGQAQTSPPVEQPTQAQGLPPGISLEDTCTEKPFGSACWLELANQPGCYLFNAYLQVDETATWSGGCVGGLAEGTGELIWAFGRGWWEDGATYTGQLRRGRYHGHWVERNRYGDVYEGPYADGKEHGRWVLRYASGKVVEGDYVDGKAHGRAVIRHTDGTVMEGPFENGLENGPWVIRYPNGDVWAGPYVDGNRHGLWIIRYAGGTVHEGLYEGGNRHGLWVERNADGVVRKGPLVNDVHHGQWVTRYPDGRVETMTYVDGEPQ